MDTARLEALIATGEDSGVEFKGVRRSGYSIEAMDLAKAISAFANSGGGHVLLGVEDDGTPSGIGTMEQADALMRTAAQVCAYSVVPSVTCRITKVKTGDVFVLDVEVPGFTTGRPYRAGSVNYVRDANTSRAASREELVRLIESSDSHFDEQPVKGSSRSDLDPEAVEALMASLYGGGREGMDIEKYLKALRCLDDEGTPTVSGILFCAADVTRWLLDAKITAVRFAGKAMTGEFQDRKEFVGPLPRQIEGIESFLETHVRAPSSIKDWQREEHGVPREVLREAVVNAVAHRDYRAASQTNVFVFDDRVEVKNPGELLNRLTIDSIRLGGISQRRNPVIATLLSRMSRRENIGIGVPEMIRLMDARGLPPPEIEVGAGHFGVTLRTKPAASP